MRCSTLLVPAVVLLAACGEGPAGPGGGLLIGRFGNPDQHVELLAVRGGADLNFPCGALFTSTRPIELRADGSFRQEGRWQPTNFGGPLPDQSATMSGVAQGETLTVTMSAEGGERYTVALERNVSGDVDAVLCALRPAAVP